MLFYDPQKNEIKPWEVSGKIIELQEGIGAAKTAVQMIRALVAALKLDPAMLGVVNRQTGHVRYWDVRQGQSGSPLYCELLCTPKWRLATPDECAREKKENDEKRKAFARNALRYDEAAAKAMAQATHFQRIVDLVDNPSPLGALTKSDIDALKAQIAEAEKKLSDEKKEAKK